MKIYLNGVGYIKINELKKEVENYTIKQPKANTLIKFEFDNQIEMDKFKSQFPKTFGLSKEYESNNLWITMLPINRNTGEKNETSEKKILRIIKVLEG